MSLAHLPESIKSEIKVNSDGKGFLSMRGMARLLGIDSKAIRHQLSTGENQPSKLLQMLMNKGFQCEDITNWSSTGIPDMAVSTITKYYAYKAGRFCKPEAELIDELFTAMGVRKAFQLSTGYTEPQQTEPVPQLPLIVREPLWTKQLPPVPEIYDQGEPSEVNYYGLVPGIDYPDPYVLEAWDKTYRMCSQCQQWEDLKEAKRKKADYLAQFDRHKLLAARLKEADYGKQDRNILNMEYRKLLVMNKIRHLKEPLPLNVHHNFYKIPAVIERYKTHYPFLTTINIYAMFIEAEQEGLGRYDLETKHFYPICCLPHVIAAQRELEQLMVVENNENNLN